MLRKNNKNGFSLVELVVVIAVMAVLIAVLAPVLLSYVEKTRMQKDESNVGELVHATQIALSDMNAFDEAYRNTVSDNYTGYVDSEGGNTVDEEFWAATGSSNKTMTITFYPEDRGTYVLGDGVVNDMGKGKSNAAKKATISDDILLKDLTDIYSLLKQSLGEKITNSSQTYRNSDYTVFIVFTLGDGMNKATVHGAFNGTNLTEDCPAANGDSNGEHIFAEDGSTRQHYCTKHPEDDSERHNPQIREGSTQCAYDGCTLSVSEPEHEQEETQGSATFNDGVTLSWDELTLTENGTKYGYDASAITDTSIGEYAFAECESLTSIIIPNSVTSIGEYAFADCTSLTSITIPNSVTSIGEYAFGACESLTSISIPNSVTNIGGGAFVYCASLTSITIPEGVTKIGYEAFAACESLTSINVATDNTTYDSRNNCNAIIETATNTLIAGCKNTVIPNSVTEIGDYAFSSCESLTSVSIPDSVTEIGYGAFVYCSSLESITIGNSVTEIGDYAFNECESLTSIVIPNSVTEIGDYAFAYCESLTSIIIPNSVTEIGKWAFDGCTALTSITIPNSVTEIGDYAFSSCKSLTSITIPEGVTSIGEGAFCICTRLTSITIPNNVTEIREYAFGECTSLTSVAYTGTQTQWKAITKGSDWKYNVPTSCIVHCTDGDIYFNNF